MALLCYVEDNGDTLPSSAIVSRAPKWNKADFVRFATRRVGSAAKAAPRTWAEALYPYHPCHRRQEGAPPSFFCPKDDAERGRPNAHVSYWWKLAVDKAWYGEGCSKPYRTAQSFPRPTRCIILYERNGWHDAQHADAGMVNGAMMYRLYLDGHAACRTLSNATSGDPKNCVANSDGEPMYFNSAKDQILPPDKPATFVDPGLYWDY